MNLSSYPTAFVDLKHHPCLIFAADVDDMACLRHWMRVLSTAVDCYKVGHRLFTACGPAAVRVLMAAGKDVFLDLKFHDIPNTVAAAAANAVRIVDPVVAHRRGEAASSLGRLLMLTVHCAGGEEMLKAAVEGVHEAAQQLGVPRPAVVGVTVLTSEGQGDNIHNLIKERVVLAQRCGLDGVVASGHEAAWIRKETGSDFLIITPGIRLQGDAADDQKRIVTPAQAVAAGSNALVVGRPLLKAADPRGTAEEIKQQVETEVSRASHSKKNDSL